MLLDDCLLSGPTDLRSSTQTQTKRSHTVQAREVRPEWSLLVYHSALLLICLIRTVPSVVKPRVGAQFRTNPVMFSCISTASAILIKIMLVLVPGVFFLLHCSSRYRRRPEGVDFPSQFCPIGRNLEHVTLFRRWGPFGKANKLETQPQSKQLF